ncbi:acyltransferase [Enterobacter ludwigii]
MSKDSVSVNINILKIIASIMVITIHVSAINFPKIGKEEWDVTNIYNSFSRVCVPLFFMISGYFLVGNNISISEFYKKRFVKIIPPILFWSVVFYFYNFLYLGAKPYNPAELLIRPASTHLWYLYAIFGLYLVTPFISKIYINSSFKERAFFVSLWFVTSSLIPIINATYGTLVNTGLFQLTSIYGYIGFFFVGAMIKDYPQQKGFVWSILFLTAYISCSYLTMHFTKEVSMANGKPTQLFYSYLSPFVIAASVCLFYFITTLKFKWPFFERIGSVFSSIALGVYCIHTIFIGVLAKEFHIGGDVNPQWLYIAFTVASTFALSCICSFLLSRIPYLRKVF